MDEVVRRSLPDAHVNPLHRLRAAWRKRGMAGYFITPPIGYLTARGGLINFLPAMIQNPRFHCGQLPQSMLKQPPMPLEKSGSFVTPQ